MKIAFDLDKTYEVNPGMFNHIAARFQVAGHEVGILSGRKVSEGMSLSFTPDFCIFLDLGEHTYAERAKLKAGAMKRNRIDILFDDRADYFTSDVVVLKIA